MPGKTKICGWRIKKMGKAGYLECPYCGYRSASMAAENEKVKCDGCKKSYGADKVKLIECNGTIVICKICGYEVSLTPDNNVDKTRIRKNLQGRNKRVKVSFYMEFIKP